MSVDQTDVEAELESLYQKLAKARNELNEHVRVVARMEAKINDLQNAFRELCEEEDILRVGLVDADDEPQKLDWDETLDAFPELSEDRILEMREKYLEIEKRFKDMKSVWFG